MIRNRFVEIKKFELFATAYISANPENTKSYRLGEGTNILNKAPDYSYDTLIFVSDIGLIWGRGKPLTSSISFHCYDEEYIHARVDENINPIPNDQYLRSHIKTFIESLWELGVVCNLIDKEAGVTFRQREATKWEEITCWGSQLYNTTLEVENGDYTLKKSEDRYFCIPNLSDYDINDYTSKHDTEKVFETKVQKAYKEGANIISTKYKGTNVLATIRDAGEVDYQGEKRFRFALSFRIDFNIFACIYDVLPKAFTVERYKITTQKG